MKRKYAFYGFRDMDHKAAEDWLMAWKARGWELERIRAGSVAVFRPLSSPEVRYAVDLAEPRRLTEDPSEDRETEYRLLCADAGWEEIGAVGAQRIYRSARGRTPIPLQTDPELEEVQFRRRVLHPALSAGAGRAASIAVYTALFLMIPGNVLYWFEVFLDLRLLLMLGGLALLGLWQLGQLFCTAAHAMRLRRALDRGKPLPRTGLRAARVRAWGALVSGVGVIILLLCALLPGESRQEHPLDPAALAAEGRPVITAAGLGGHDRESDVMWQEGNPLLSGVSFVQGGMPEGGVLYVERLDAHCPVLAEMAFRELSAKADRDGTRPVICGQGEGIPLTAAVPGVETALLRYERGQYLLLHSGSTVVRVMADKDFTEPAVLATIVSQMRLGA